MDSAVPCEDNILLKKAHKKIANLKEDVPRLSDEWQRKDSLLSSFIVADQFKKLAHKA